MVSHRQRKNKKNPGANCTGVVPRMGLERREVEKRIYGGKAAAHGFRNLSVIKIPPGFERLITELKTKFDKIVNKDTVPKGTVS